MRRGGATTVVTAPVCDLPLPTWYTKVGNLDANFRGKLKKRSLAADGEMPKLALVKDYPVLQIIEPGANRDGPALRHNPHHTTPLL